MLTLLELPLGNESFFTYSVDLKKPCTFEGVVNIQSNPPTLEKSSWIIEKINELQMKVNLEIDKFKITPDSLLFSLVSARNITFEFSFKKPECTLKKSLLLDGITYRLDEIIIEYLYVVIPTIRAVESILGIF
jgi:hypothetical protein